MINPKFLLFYLLLLLFPLSAYSQIEVLPCGSIQFGEILVDPEGGRVSCAHTMENLDLHMDSGGTFSVDESWEETTGKVIPAQGKGFSVPPGGRFELNKGKITNH